MSMLDRAAKALAEKDGYDWEAMTTAQNPAMREFQNDYRADARLVLQAIRDLPASMVETAAANVFGPDPLPHEVSNFDGGYVSLIDAILNPGTET